MSLGNVPEGAVHKGCQDHTVRDIVLHAEEAACRREVWEFPDGSRHVAPLPPGAGAGRERHGPCARALAIMLHHQCQSTAGRIAGMPAAIGLDISERRAGRFPTADAGGIAGEQQEVLRAGLETAARISADDTGARHKAGNGYCTAIGNDFFAHFRSTGSKSRLDFLERPCAGEEDCTVNDAALECMRKRNLSGRAVALLAGHERRRFGDGWRAHLEALGIAGMTVSPDPARIATEGALWGTVRDAGRIAGTVIPVDDAGQFNVGDLHALCRFHAERNIARPTGSAPYQHERVDGVLDKVWKLYRSLCRYRKRPTPLRKLVMEKRFDRIFGTAAGCASLDRLLERLAANRDELLRVPGRPETPLNANRAGNDIRDHAARRKVSFGTRSDAGRAARDACIGAKKTCGKLGVPCRDCPRSRLGVAGAPEVPRLADLVRQRAAA